MAGKMKFDAMYMETPEESNARKLKGARNRAALVADAYINEAVFEQMYALDDQIERKEHAFVKGDATAFGSLLKLMEEKRNLESLIADAKAIRKDFFGNYKVSTEEKETTEQ